MENITNNDKILLIIKKHALANAISHDGKAFVGSVIGKIVAEDQSLKMRLGSLKEVIVSTVDFINSMSPDKQRFELEKISPEMLKKKKKQEKGLNELPNAIFGKVVTRIPPEPSKYLHVGHALSFLINYLYAKKYDGKSVLRFEDTNPEKATQEFVDSITENILDYLEIVPEKILFVSDDVDKMYSLARSLVEKGQAYVCSCTQQEMHDLREKGTACTCRSNDIKKNLSLWNDMLKGKFDDGERVLRLKIDMKAKNAVMRDPVIFRIVKHEHYRQKNKFCVWPMYDFEAAIEEHLCGITHVLRSNEFGSMRVELQNYIRNLFGFENPTFVQYGRFNIVGAITEGRKIRQMIENHEVFGWDDPRLVTLKALRRRGFVKEMYYELVKEVGLSPTPTNIDWSLLNTTNRKIIDPISKRYFFIEDPVKIKVFGTPEKDVHLKFHPSDDKALKEFRINGTFYITRKDYNKIMGFDDGEPVRLIDCINFTRKGNEFLFLSTDYADFKDKGNLIIHWLPDDKNNVPVKIVMPDISEVSGIGEKYLKNLKIGDIVQFQRFGFARFDSSEEGYVFYYTHN